VKALAFLCLTIALLGCATTGGPAVEKPPVIDKPLRHLLTATTVSPELAGKAGPQIFESSLCAKLFDYNKQHVTCADEMRVLLAAQRDRTVLGDPGAENLTLLEPQNYPRRISLSAAKAGEAMVITILVQNGAGETLGRFQVPMASDGSDVMERAASAAIQILKIP